MHRPPRVPMLLALLTASALALPVLAQAQTPGDAPPPAATTAADCAAGVTLMQMLIPLDAAPAVAGPTDGWCALDGAEFGWPGAPIQRRIARIAWRAPGLAAAVDGGPPPLWMDLRLGGITQRFVTGDARIDYQLDVQSRVPGTAIDADLALRLDPGAGLLVMDRLRIALPMGNGVDLQARVETAPWPAATPWSQAIDGPEALRVTRLDLALDLRGLFEFYILPALLDRMAPDEVVGVIAGLKADLTAAQATADPTGLAPETRAALARLLADLPNPHGRLILTLRSDRGLDGAALMALDLTRPDAALRQILALFDGAAVTMTYPD
jgi:hypothetical protein